MKKKVKRFQEGGFSEAQEEWLTRGGQSPDRTDPYILARMRSAVPDEKTPKKTSRDFDVIDEDMVAPSRDLTAPVSVTKTKTSVTATPKATPKSETKSTAPAMPAEEKARLEKIGEKQKLGRVEPEGFIPGPRMIANLLKSGANLLGKKKLREYSMDEFEKMTPKLGREPLKLPMKKGGAVKKMASGGKVSSASRRGDGCAIRGKTKGRMM
jgi:hypothetical protein